MHAITRDAIFNNANKLKPIQQLRQTLLCVARLFLFVNTQVDNPCSRAGMLSAGSAPVS